MTNLIKVTFTGVDESTDFNDVFHLHDSYYNDDFDIEFVVVYNASKAGIDPRYPSWQWINEFGKFARINCIDAALHVCGTATRNLIRKNKYFIETTPLYKLSSLFDRVQLNSIYNSFHTVGICQLLSLTQSHLSIILQHNPNSEHLCGLLDEVLGLHFLVDNSSSEDISSEKFLDPKLQNFTGFAGGLGPDNVAEQVAHLNTFGREFWIDMESKVRNSDNKFDLSLCAKVLDNLK